MKKSNIKIIPVFLILAGLLTYKSLSLEKPEGIQAWGMALVCSYDEGLKDRCDGLMNSAVETVPEEFKEQAMIATADLKYKWLPGSIEVVEQYRQILDKYKNSKAALYRLAVLSEESKTRIEYATRLQKIDSENAAANYILAAEYYAQNQFDKAAAEIEKGNAKKRFSLYEYMPDFPDDLSYPDSGIYYDYGFSGKTIPVSYLAGLHLENLYSISRPLMSRLRGFSYIEEDNPNISSADRLDWLRNLQKIGFKMLKTHDCNADLIYHVGFGQITFPAHELLEADISEAEKQTQKKILKIKDRIVDLILELPDYGDDKDLRKKILSGEINTVKDGERTVKIFIESGLVDFF